jgi:hypothetical protein
MSDELRQHLKGCLVLVTSDGERFLRTRIAEVTPSGRHVRLESDALTPAGLQRWRALDSIQILEAFASPSAPSTMHGIVRLKNPATRSRPPIPPLPPTPAFEEASNIIEFPLPATPQKIPTTITATQTALGT